IPHVADVPRSVNRSVSSSVPLPLNILGMLNCIVGVQTGEETSPLTSNDVVPMVPFVGLRTMASTWRMAPETWGLFTNRRIFSSPTATQTVRDSADAFGG